MKNFFFLNFTKESHGDKVLNANLWPEVAVTYPLLSSSLPTFCCHSPSLPFGWSLPTSLFRKAALNITVLYTNTWVPQLEFFLATKLSVCSSIHKQPKIERWNSSLLAEKKNVQLKGIKWERCHRLESILCLLAWFAADVFAHNTKKYQKTHIAD